MRLLRRALFPEAGEDCHDPSGYGCSPPSPPPVPSTYNPGLAPSPSPSDSPPPALLPACPPLSRAPAPAPSPMHGGRRDQGGGGGGVRRYGPPPGVGDHHHRRHIVSNVLVAAGVVAFVSLILLGVSVAVRRRQVRRRRQALLAPAVAPDGGGGGGGNDPEDGGCGGGGGGGGVVHHIWYIRTVGLDEAAISSLAVTRYRAGAGLLGAADCSVCLGEFQDGERVRLLPKCGHAFHVPCIDTWLRAHVNCPLCRSDVLGPAVTAASTESSGSSFSNPPADPDANANDAADQVAAASDAASDHEEEEEESGRQGASPAEEDQNQQSSSPELPSPSPPPPPPPPRQLFCPLPRNVRRAASMDAAIVSTAAADAAALHRLPEAAPEEEEQMQIEIGGRRKRGAGPSCAKASGSGHRGNLSADRPASGGVPRSFFSRHSRARGSVLPLGLD